MSSSTNTPLAERPVHTDNRAANHRLGLLLAYGAGLLPLVCLPNLEHPFSTPKLSLLAALAAWASLLLLRAPGKSERGPRGLEWAAVAWLGVLGVSASLRTADWKALLLLALPVPLLFAARRGVVPAEDLQRTVVFASGIESIIALLQFAGSDPLQWLGWRPEQFASPRMRVYGTLGNPNFVAAWLVATLPLAVVWALSGEGRRRWLRWALVALQFAAVAATGSRAALLALPLGGLALLLCRVKARGWCLGGACVVAVLLWLTPARPLTTTLKGRLAIDHAVLRHALEVPPWGFGPGAFALRFPAWQVEETGLAATPLDHAHNDFLEIYVDTGALGLGAFVALSACLLIVGFKHARGAPVAAAGALAGAIALLAVATVDFPFHRPAEWGVYWLLLGLAARRDTPGPAAGGESRSGQVEPGTS